MQNFQDKRDHKNSSAPFIHSHEHGSHWFEIRTQQVGFQLKADSYQKVTCIMKQVGHETDLYKEQSVS